MSDHKIKNREALLSHGDAGAKAQVLELTERVLHRLDARKRLHEMMHREGSELVIRVIDTGCGIPAQYRESIFQPFFRVEQSRSRAYGGVGLGLALVWESAALHGGRVAAEQSDETGTTMAVRLPAGRE